MAPQSRQRSAAQNIGVLMLLYHLKQFGFNRIPPVTLMTIVGMAREFRRVFLSAIEHGDDMHLFYNMISYLVKGVSLERKLGSVYFAYLIFVFCNACSLVYILLANGMAQLFNEPFFLDQCAIGFSGGFSGDPSGRCISLMKEVHYEGIRAGE
ncbi:unnamed protein product [Notodromas monacha]|uniref:Peptidase S54 rhomboid domain-containing protein n=1 Tax=Notodromas monacha TaxID=399045 RepID=A0A7R9GH83_9CRUS|nr:unnamed protein product [Notodromas monacha]CAG0922506.1 unnamed protein product [Notodromas monacha]